MALNNVPLSGQTLNTTRIPINSNFSTINAAFLVDHVEYATPGAGKHNKVTFPVQGSAPAFSSTDNGFYEFPYNNLTNTIPELFIHKQTSAAPVDIPFTSSIMSQDAATGNDTSGFTYLPSGILWRWQQNIPVNGLTTITLSTNKPAFNAIFSVQVTPDDNSSGSVNKTVRFVDILNNTQFRLYSSGSTTCTVWLVGR